MNRIGIDVGGTNVKLALVNDKGEIKYSNSVPTRAEMGYEYTVENIKQAIKDTGIEVPEDLSFREYGSKIQEVIDTTIIPQSTLDEFVEFTNTINGSKEVN